MIQLVRKYELFFNLIGSPATLYQLILKESIKYYIVQIQPNQDPEKALQRL